MSESVVISPPGQDLTAVAEWVAEILRERIIKGQLAPGARIVERKISAELEISRTPVREALKLLQADHLIEISRNKGAQVTKYAPLHALDLFDVIASLESLAAERLATTIKENDLSSLEKLHAQMLLHHKMGSAEEYFDTNSTIHEAILKFCGNPVLIEAHTKLMARARRGRFMAIMKPERWNEAVDEHEQLMVALRIRDGAGAGRIWRDHLKHTGRTVAEVLKKNESQLTSSPSP